ncbi:MAG: hypothetical protein ACYS8X_03025 [Planctomycetota bacterium]|jgi:hypothetical protein
MIDKGDNAMNAPAAGLIRMVIAIACLITLGCDSDVRESDSTQRSTDTPAPPQPTTLEIEVRFLAREADPQAVSVPPYLVSQTALLDESHIASVTIVETGLADFSEGTPTSKVIPTWEARLYLNDEGVSVMKDQPPARPFGDGLVLILDGKPLAMTYGYAPFDPQEVDFYLSNKRENFFSEDGLNPLKQHPKWRQPNAD